MSRRLTRELDKLKPGDEVDLRVYANGQTKIGEGQDGRARSISTSRRRRRTLATTARRSGFNLAVDRQPPRHDRRVRDVGRRRRVRPRKPGSKREAASRRSTASTCAARRRRRRRLRRSARRTSVASRARSVAAQAGRRRRPAGLLQRSVPQREGEGGPRERSAASQSLDDDHRRRQLRHSVDDASPGAGSINGEQIGDDGRDARSSGDVGIGAANVGRFGGAHRR